MTMMMTKKQTNIRYSNTGRSIFHGSERSREKGDSDACIQLGWGSERGGIKKQVMELSHLQVTCLPVAGHLLGHFSSQRPLLLSSRPKEKKKYRSALQWSARPVPIGSSGCACANNRQDSASPFICVEICAIQPGLGRSCSCVFKWIWFWLSCIALVLIYPFWQGFSF